ncbi:MAG: protein-tyrosine-phosphatase [Piscirickettsiaceae bacterium]|nr:MAG: protein-tyrosine-phosphatase [Piscirickettsiaceae bacterium]
MSLLFNFLHGNKIKVLMVCTANVCRSPMAHAVLREMVASRGLADKIYVDSAGTHVPIRGLKPDKRTLAVLTGHGIKINNLKTRQLKKGDFTTYDYILVMDESNRAATLKIMDNRSAVKKVEFLLNYAGNSVELNVQDPYYSHPAEFEDMYAVMDKACSSLLVTISQTDLA